jgi:hypothetical protein
MESQAFSGADIRMRMKGQGITMDCFGTHTQSDIINQRVVGHVGPTFGCLSKFKF